MYAFPSKLSISKLANFITRIYSESKSTTIMRTDESHERLLPARVLATSLSLIAHLHSKSTLLRRQDWFSENCVVMFTIAILLPTSFDCIDWVMSRISVLKIFNDWHNKPLTFSLWMNRHTYRGRPYALPHSHMSEMNKRQQLHEQQHQQQHRHQICFYMRVLYMCLHCICMHESFTNTFDIVFNIH